MSKAHVHRYHDCVAVSLATSETIYLTPQEARALASALNKAARSVERVKFIDSDYGMFSLDVETTGHNGTRYKHERPVAGLRRRS